jgi:hypothetical protein
MAPRSGHCPNRRPLAVRTAGEAGETKPQSPAEIALHPASSILYHIFLPPSNPFLRCPIPPLKAKIRLPMPLPRAMAGFGLRHRPRKIFFCPFRGNALRRHYEPVRIGGNALRRHYERATGNQQPITGNRIRIGGNALRRHYEPATDNQQPITGKRVRIGGNALRRHYERALARMINPTVPFVNGRRLTPTATSSIMGELKRARGGQEK